MGESWRASTLCWDSSGSWKARTSPCTKSGARWCATATPIAALRRILRVGLHFLRRRGAHRVAREVHRLRHLRHGMPHLCSGGPPPERRRSCGGGRASRAANEGVAYLGCGELLERARGRYDEEKIARVECLGRVDEALLADLAVEGAREVVLIHGDCERCEHKRGRACARGGGGNR